MLAIKLKKHLKLIKCVLMVQNHIRKILAKRVAEDLDA